MKKILSIIMVLTLCFALFAGCGDETKPEADVKPETEAKSEPEAKPEEAEEKGSVVSPLPETVDVANLENCTVAASLEKGDAYVDDSGKMMMKVKVYTYDLYDMVDIASLKENDVIIHRGEEVKVTEIERLESGLIHINGGEENGGFDLISNGDTVYYEIGMNDLKAYNEIGEAVLPVSTEFIYTDSSDIEAAAKEYYPGDFLTDNAGIEYDFHPNNTSIVIEDGVIIGMEKVYNP